MIFALALAGCSPSQEQAAHADLDRFTREVEHVAATVAGRCEAAAVQAVVLGVRGGAPGWLEGALQLGECVFIAVLELATDATLAADELARARLLYSAARSTLAQTAH